MNEVTKEIPEYHSVRGVLSRAQDRIHDICAKGDGSQTPDGQLGGFRHLAMLINTDVLDLPLNGAQENFITALVERGFEERPSRFRAEGQVPAEALVAIVAYINSIRIPEKSKGTDESIDKIRTSVAGDATTTKTE